MILNHDWFTVDSDNAHPAVLVQVMEDDEVRKREGRRLRMVVSEHCTPQQARELADQFSRFAGQIYAAAALAEAGVLPPG